MKDVNLMSVEELREEVFRLRRKIRYDDARVAHEIDAIRLAFLKRPPYLKNVLVAAATLGGKKHDHHR